MAIPEIKMSTYENKALRILSAFSIISIIFGHHGLPNHIPFIDFWRIPAFLFVAGYFFKDLNFSQYFFYIKKQFKKLIIPYTKYFMLFLAFYISLGYLKLAPILTLHNILFKYAYNSIGLFWPSWFLIMLFLGNISYMFIRILFFKKIKKNLNMEISLFLILFVISLFSIHYGSEFPADENFARKTLIIRNLALIGYSIFFIHLGYFYKNYIEEFDITTTTKFVLAIALCLALDAKSYIDVSRFLLNNQSKIYCIVFDQMASLYIMLHISKFIASNIFDDNILLKIGKNTLNLMFFHTLSFGVYTFFRYKVLDFNLIHHYAPIIKFIFAVFSISFIMYFPTFSKSIKTYFYMKLANPKN